jgi:hypothetical protein
MFASEDKDDERGLTFQLRDNPELFFVLPALTLVQKDGSDNVVHISGYVVGGDFRTSPFNAVSLFHRCHNSVIKPYAKSRVISWRNATTSGN